jgi:8-oxo-dGTP pyrophosphatase MutT (NUDIX family)
MRVVGQAPPFALGSRPIVKKPVAIQPIRPAASVILARDTAPGFEILMLRRTAQAAFAGGMYVFPGGRVDGDDHLHVYDAIRRGPNDFQAPQQRALGAEWRGFWIAGIRESFEEAGVMLAYDSGGALLDLHDDTIRARFDGYRRALHDGELSLDEICAREGLMLAIDRMHFLNRWITPEGRPRRFDTRFFIAEAPAKQHGRHDEYETVDSLWISPADALARNDRGEFGLMSVTRRQLETLADFATMRALHDLMTTDREFPTYRPVLSAAQLDSEG